MSYNQFLNTINKFSSNDVGIKTSHTCLDPPRAFHVIEDEHKATILDEYCRSEMKKCHIGEVLDDVRPLLIDVDISRAVRPDDVEGSCMSLYSRDDLIHTVRVIHECIDDIFSGCDRIDELKRCVYLEKPSYISREKYKNGFHLQFPYLFSNHHVFEDNVFPRISEIINHYYEHKYGYKQVLDNGVKVWLLYGANKPTDKYVYRVKAIFDSQCKDVGLDGLIGYDERVKSVEDVKKYLPGILSTHCMGRREVTCTIPLRRSYLYKQAVRDDLDVDEKVDYIHNMKLVAEVLPLLSDDRVRDYQSWIRVGWGIRTSCGSSKESLQLWLDFSARCPDKYDERDCVRKWGRMNAHGITIGTILQYAREDSPAKYSEVCVSKDDKLLRNCLSQTHNDIAVYLKREFGDQFMCTHHVKKEWYHFENHRWRKVDGNIDLLDCISNVFVPMLVAQHHQLKMAGLSADNGNMNPNQAVLDLYWKLILRLKDVGYKSNVAKECSQVFYQKDTAALLDANPDLICFKNGVYDFTERRFRPGLCQDYLTKQMPIAYREYDMFSTEVATVNNFLKQVFPDPEIREYWLTVNSGIFRGGNMDKKIFVWSGAGNNAKSITQKIIEGILGGEYAKSLSPAIINNGRTSAGQASPEIARSGGGVRQLFVQEPDKNKDINVDVLKQLSGNDKQFARDLYQSGADSAEITPMFKLAIICNELPSISTADKATWNRIRVLPFESTFSDQAPKDPDEQMRTKTFPIDRRFEERIPDLLEPLAFMLLQKFLETDGVAEYEPKKVRAATELYQKCNDLIGLFISEELEVAQGHSVTPNEMFAHYKTWYKNNSVNANLNVTQRDTNERIRLRLKIKTHDFENYRIKSADGLL